MRAEQIVATELQDLEAGTLVGSTNCTSSHPANEEAQAAVWVVAMRERWVAAHSNSIEFYVDVNTCLNQSIYIVYTFVYVQCMNGSRSGLISKLRGTQKTVWNVVHESNCYADEGIVERMNPSSSRKEEADREGVAASEPSQPSI